MTTTAGRMGDILRPQANVRDRRCAFRRQRTVVAEAASKQVSAIEFGADLKTSENLTAAQHDEIRRIAHQSTVDANKRAYLFTILTTLRAFGLATRLPKGLDVERNEPLQPVAAGP